MKNLESLLISLMREVAFLFQDSFPIAKELNESLAYILTDLLPFINRQLVFSLVKIIDSDLSLSSLLFSKLNCAQPLMIVSQQIQKYSENIQYSDPEQLIALKFDFIKIICGYEHYIPLNFPLRNSVDNPFEKLENLQRDFWSVPEA